MSVSEPTEAGPSSRKPLKRPAVGTTQTQFVITHANVYYAEGQQDEALWESVKDDFGEWSLNNLGQCDRATLHKFRNFLRQRGVWVAKVPGITPIGPLYDLFRETKPAEWPRYEIEEHINKEGRFTSDAIHHYMIKNDILIPPDLPQSQASSVNPFSRPPSPEPHQTVMLSPANLEYQEPPEHPPRDSEPTRKPGQEPDDGAGQTSWNTSTYPL
jgi:hypothetical protein